MKKLLNLSLVFFGLFYYSHAVAQEEKPEPSVNLRYFNKNGSMQYLEVKAMIKEDNKLQPLSGASIQVYLDEALPEFLISKVKTDEKGEAKTVIPVSLKSKWSESSTHNFIAVTEGSKRYAETTTELEVGKAKMIIDTLNEEGARKVAIQFLSFDSSGWVPVKEVELRIGVRRLGGDLKIGDEETYTTDSLGQVTGDFKLEKLPAVDAKNNIVLVAKTEDNEQFGNLEFEKSVPWGNYVKTHSNFNERSLWGTRDKTPIWLLLMAGSIVTGVWGVLIYLLFQLVRIKKDGKSTVSENSVVINEPEIAHV